MTKQIQDKMSILKKAFFVLLVLDLIETILVGIALISTFKTTAEYGEMVMIISIVIIAMTVAVLLFELFAKIFLIRSTSPAFSRANGRKGYVVVSILLWICNFGAAIIGLLSIGGEGATLLNQSRMYIHLFASVAEMMVVSFYLHTTKKLFMDTKKDNKIR